MVIIEDDFPLWEVHIYIKKVNIFQPVFSIYSQSIAFLWKWKILFFSVSVFICFQKSLLRQDLRDIYCKLGLQSYLVQIYENHFGSILLLFAHPQTKPRLVKTMVRTAGSGVLDSIVVGRVPDVCISKLCEGKSKHCLDLELIWHGK